MTGRPQLVDTAPADVFRDGVNEERHILRCEFEAHDRRDVLDRMRTWETQIVFLHRRIERLRGRMGADNQWLAEHPDGST